MKSKAAALLMTATLFLLALNVCLAATVLFEDKFTTLDPAWGAPSDTLDVRDGKLVITPEKNTTQTIINQGNLLPNDVDASFNLTFVKANAPTWGSGLVFWAKDYDEYYTFLLNSQGWFGVQRHVSNRYLLPVAWRQSEAIKKGEGADNLVRVVTHGKQATIFINGKEVIRVGGQPPEGGSLIGFKAASGPEGTNTVAFSNLQVSQP
jgi:hypothetical protein